MSSEGGGGDGGEDDDSETDAVAAPTAVAHTTARTPMRRLRDMIELAETGQSMVATGIGAFRKH